MALALAAVPVVAGAQDTTLDYQGYVMGGTSTVTAVPYSFPVGTVASAPISTTATFDASVTYSGSVAQNNLVIDSYQINLTANNGQNFELQNIGAPAFNLNGPSLCLLEGASGCVTLTTSGNTVTGATINFFYNVYHDASFDLGIGPSGDAFSETAAFGGFYGCSNSGSGAFAYVGPAAASPCSMNLSNPTAGVWTTASPAPVAAPEIDSTSAASGLTLLLGGLLVLRGRRARI
jgi:hypothetical protein